MGWLYERVYQLAPLDWRRATHRFKTFPVLPVFPKLELAIAFEIRTVDVIVVDFVERDHGITDSTYV